MNAVSWVLAPTLVLIVLTNFGWMRMYYQEKAARRDAWNRYCDADRRARTAEWELSRR